MAELAMPAQPRARVGAEEGAGDFPRERLCLP